MERAAFPGVVICGHFAFGHDRIGGQVLRTRLLHEELRLRLGEGRVLAVDTQPITQRPFRTYLKARQAFRDVPTAVVMPGRRGLKYLTPRYVSWKRRYSTNLYLVAVGGWLPQFLRNNEKVLILAHSFDGIFVQTSRMVSELKKMGLANVHHLPNFKRFVKDPTPVRRLGAGDDLKLVFLSRVIPEKGVEIAIEAVARVNAGLAGSSTLSLDIWGPVPDEHRDWFDQLMAGAPSSVAYQGVLSPDEVRRKLLGYDAMLFPTHYPGEGFPGVVLDAYIAGIPVIASDWNDNMEVVEHGVNGWIVAHRSVSELAQGLSLLFENPHLVNELKRGARDSALQYHVDRVISEFIARLQF